MRITIVLPYASMSGGIRVPAIYAKHLQSKGHKVTLVSITRKPVSARRCLGMLIRGQWHKLSCKQGPTHLDGAGLDWQIVNAQQITDADLPDADIVIATWWETAHWVAKLSPSKGKKCYFMQDYGAPGQTLCQIVPTWRLGLPMITISDWLENLVRTHVPQAQISTVHNSVDLEMFGRDQGFEGRDCVGVVYNKLKTKRVELAGQAVDLAARNIPGLELQIVGPEGKMLGTNSRVLGRLDDQQVREAYNRCRAWIFPSELEGFGLPILEAMACGTPVIATPAGAATELIAQGGGLLTPHGDAQAMSQAIEQVFALSQPEWEELSQAGLATARSHSWEAAGDAFEAELLKQVAPDALGKHAKSVESRRRVG